MTRRIVLLLLLVTSDIAWPEILDHGLQVDVKREGSLYSFKASFDTALTTCEAYRYLTDYEAAIRLPGVVESSAQRQADGKVRVERKADERILLFTVRLHSVMEYTERPYAGISFKQVAGDSKAFQGDWDIESNQRGSTLRFAGSWQPDSLIPLFVIDHFARNGLIDKFTTIAQLADKRKELAADRCVD